MGFTIAYAAVTWTAGDVITEAKMDNMVANDQAYDSHSAQGFEIDEMSKPSTPAANKIRLYAKDKSGVSTLYYLKDNGNEIELGEVTPPDGWIPVSTVPTYASASTLNVPSGAASIYKKGDKYKFTQHGVVKHFYIIGVADTLLTVTAGTDNVVENTATYPITLPYYSHQENPIGFPAYFSCGAFTFDVNTVDNGSGGQPTAGSNKFFIINGRLIIRGAFGGSNVYKVGTNNQIKTTALPSTLPANSSLFNVPCGICNTGYGGVIIDRDSSSFWFQYSTNINDNTDLTYQGWEFSYFI